MEVLLWDLKKVLCLLLSKSLSEFHLYIIRTGKSEVATTRSYIANDLKFYVGSQSHKRGCLCAIDSNKRVCQVGAACDCVSKFYKR